MSICPITSDAKFGHFVKVLSARILHCKSILFSLSLMSSCGVILKDNINILFSNNLSLNGFNI